MASLGGKAYRAIPELKLPVVPSPGTVTLYRLSLWNGFDAVDGWAVLSMKDDWRRISHWRSKFDPSF